MTGLSSGTVTGPNESAKHPTKDLDDLVHQRGRLGILTVLAAKNRADFSYLQTALDMTRAATLAGTSKPSPTRSH